MLLIAKSPTQTRKTQRKGNTSLQISRKRRKGFEERKSKIQGCAVSERQQEDDPGNEERPKSAPMGERRFVRNIPILA
jgi:hypothetical protein